MFFKLPWRFYECESFNDILLYKITTAEFSFSAKIPDVKFLCNSDMWNVIVYIIMYI